MQNAKRKMQNAKWRKRTRQRSPCPLVSLSPCLLPSPPSTVYRLPSPAPRAAFTLLELLLVLALIAAVAALAWPALDRPLATQRLRRAAEQVRMQLIKTRTKAINTGETFSFRYQPDKPLMRIEACTQNEALLAASSTLGATGSSFGGSMQMGGGPMAGASAAIQSSAGAMGGRAEPLPPVEDVLPEPIVFYGGEVASDARADQLSAQERMKGSVDLSWSQPVLFYPDGTALAARIALAGDRGRAIVIEVRSLTGAVRLGEIVTVEDLRR
jgi:prepilin-type N-terminal cleavage/methylation domain-containing protein